MQELKTKEGRVIAALMEAVIKYNSPLISRRHLSKELRKHGVTLADAEDLGLIEHKKGGWVLIRVDAFMTG